MTLPRHVVGRTGDPASGPLLALEAPRVAHRNTYGFSKAIHPTVTALDGFFERWILNEPFAGTTERT